MILDGMHKKFYSVFFWNLGGSIIYEFTKICCNALIMHACLPDTMGALASTLSFLYLAFKITDLGMTYSMPSFFLAVTHSKEHLRNFFISSYFNAAPLSFLFAAGLLVLMTKTLKCPWTMLTIFCAGVIIITETLRSSLRVFLHMAGFSSFIVIYEVISFLCYKTIITSFIIFVSPQNPLPFVLLLHAAESFFAVLFMSFLTHQFYQRLPTRTNDQYLPMRSLIKTRVSTYLLHLSREFFTPYTLTPFVAMHFGLGSAGGIFFIGGLVNSLKSIVKVSLGYSSSTFLALLKNSQRSFKKGAFALIGRTFFMAVVPLVILAGFAQSGPKPALFPPSNHSQGLTTFFIPLVILMASDFVVLLYEQLYIIEDRASVVLWSRLFEGLFFLMSFMLAPAHIRSVYCVILFAILSRFAGLLLVATDAYRRWGITFFTK